MNIVFDVLRELKFKLNDKYIVENITVQNNRNGLEVNVLISEANPSQVFLVTECLNEYLSAFVSGELVEKIASEFRGREYHRAEMDRNTTLLILSKCRENENTDVSSKVRIEDDPYYFKKYVLSYDETELESVEQCTELNGDGSKIEAIQKYIVDPNKFTKFKENSINDLTYAFLIELVTKIHCFPLNIKDIGAKVSSQGKNETQEKKDLEQFLYEELEETWSGNKESIDVKRKMVEAICENAFDTEDIDSICEMWDSLKVIKEDD